MKRLLPPHLAARYVRIVLGKLIPRASTPHRGERVEQGRSCQPSLRVIRGRRARSICVSKRASWIVWAPLVAAGLGLGASITIFGLAVPLIFGPTNLAPGRRFQAQIPTAMPSHDSTNTSSPNHA